MSSWIGLPIDSTCGARGTCGKCKVRLLRGQNGTTAADRNIFTKEELADGWRLSCRAQVHQDIVCQVWHTYCRTFDPQWPGGHGADVIARISHTMLNEGGLSQLQEKIIQSLNQLVAQLLDEAGVSSNEVYEVTVAGNATMQHLLLGVDPEAIGVTPFIRRDYPRLSQTNCSHCRSGRTRLRRGANQRWDADQ